MHRAFTLIAASLAAATRDEQQKAIALFERYAEGGDDAAIKAWAAKHLPDRRSHYDMALAFP